MVEGSSPFSGVFFMFLIYQFLSQKTVFKSKNLYLIIIFVLMITSNKHWYNLRAFWHGSYHGAECLACFFHNFLPHELNDCPERDSINWTKYYMYNCMLSTQYLLLASATACYLWHTCSFRTNIISFSTLISCKVPPTSISLASFYLTNFIFPMF